MILLDCVAKVESAGRLGALRFEPTVFQGDPRWIQGQLSKIMRANTCNEATALMIASTSWGKFQMLGANIYSFTDGDVALNEIFANAGLQQKIYEDFISPRGYNGNELVNDWSEARFQAFALFQNGPGNITGYVSAMKEAINA